MNIKLSHIALALITSVSFSAVAENVVPDSGVTADADVTIVGGSTLSLSIAPVTGVTVEQVRKASTANKVILAKYKLIGDNAAVRMVNADAKYPYCTTSAGTSFNDNKLEICIDDQDAKKFSVNSNTYYKLNAGEC